MADYHFSDDALQALRSARQCAVTQKASSVDIDHIALGILLLGESRAVKILSELGFDSVQLRSEVTERLQKKKRWNMPRAGLPYSRRGRRVLETAIVSSKRTGCTYVGSEHLLHAVLLDGAAIASQILSRDDLTEFDYRNRLTGQSAVGDAASPGNASRHAKARIVVLIESGDGRIAGRSLDTINEALQYLQSQQMPHDSPDHLGIGKEAQG